VAPWPPMNDSFRSAATHGDAVAVAGVGVVVACVELGGDAVEVLSVADAGGSTGTLALECVLEAPQADTSSAAASMPAVTAGCLVILSCFVACTESSSRALGIAVACQYLPDPMDTEAPRRAQPPSRSGIVAALNRLTPFWEPQLVVLAALLLDLALPPRLTLGPSWLLPSVEGLLLIGLAVASTHPQARYSPLRRQIALGLIGLVSAVNAVSLGLLSHYLLHHGTGNGRELIFSGVALWGTNVLLFALWYFELDRGGPVARATGNERCPDFMFVQMTDGARFAPPGWKPKMIDYMYTSFTNATAFSPTDTMPLTPAAKILMSGQAVIALITLGLVVARAVNILA